MKIKVGDLVGHTRDRGPSGPGLVIDIRERKHEGLTKSFSVNQFLVKFNSSPGTLWYSDSDLAKIERR